MDDHLREGKDSNLQGSIAYRYILFYLPCIEQKLQTNQWSFDGVKARGREADMTL